MKNYMLPIFIILAFLVGVSTPALALEHFPETENSDASFSIVIRGATIDGEAMQAGDEIGVFGSEWETCCGATVLEQAIDPDDPDTRAWIVAYGNDAFAEEDEQQYYYPTVGEDIYYRVWDSEADEEWDAEYETIFGANGGVFTVSATTIELSAERVYVPEFAIDILEIDFGNVVDEENHEGTDEFTVWNAGAGELSIDDMVVEGDYFTTDWADEAVVLQEDELKTTVTFAPEEEGAFEGTITVSWSDPNTEDAGEVVIDLFGRYEEPRPIISLRGSRLQGDDAAYSYIFASQYAGSQVPKEWILYIDNVGDVDLAIQDVYIDGDDAFSIARFDGEFGIAPGNDSLLVILFQPPQVGDFAADLVIESNDDITGEGMVVVSLTGEGLGVGDDPVLKLNSYDHFFSSVDFNSEDHWRLEITNGGGADLWVSDVMIDGSDAFTTNFMGEYRLRPFDHMYVTVTYTGGDQEMLDYGNVLIYANDPEFADPDNEGEFLPDTVWMAASVRELPNMHYHWFVTDANASHSMLVEALTLDGDALSEGDEIAIFTEAGLLAGGGVVNDEGLAGLAAFPDGNPDDNVVTGFEDGEEFRFMIWDMDANRDYPAMPEWTDGDEVFTTNGFSVLNLAASSDGIDFRDPNIVVPRRMYNFGEVLVDDMTRDWRFPIINNGDDDLVITSVQSDLRDEFIRDPDEMLTFPVTMAPGDRIYVNVRFDPNDMSERIGRLSINSNDPNDDVVYVDIVGVGVETLTVPWLAVMDQWVFFGADRAGDEEAIEMAITIWNDGGGENDLVIDGLEYEGSDAFTNDFDAEAGLTIAAGESADLTVMFDPADVGMFDGMFTLSSNDEINSSFPIWVRGVGTDSDDYFLNYETEKMMEISVDKAYLILPEGYEPENLSPGDEVAAFNEMGLCVGHFVAPDASGEVSLMVYGDDPATDFTEGAYEGDMLDFAFFDSSIPEQLDDVSLVPDESVYYYTDDFVAIEEMSAEQDDVEANVGIYPAEYDFGPLNIEAGSASTTFTVVNTGGGQLTILDIYTTRGDFTTDWEDGNEVVLEADEEYEVEVTFDPAGAPSRQEFLVVVSDDPDEADVEKRARLGGTGSDLSTYYQRFRSDVSHGLIVEPRFGESDDENPPFARPGDEVAAFTPDGVCAGVGVVGDAEGGFLAIFGAFMDDGETWNSEGFSNGETITLRFYDASRMEEHVEGDGDGEFDVEVDFGSLNFQANAAVRVFLWIHNVWTLSENSEAEYVESDEIEFTVAAVNAPDGMMIDLLNADDLPAEIEAVDNGDNTMTVSWATDYSSAGEYELEFYAYDDADEPTEEDWLTVNFEVININADPEVNDEGVATSFTWNEENGVWELTVAEDQGSENAGWIRIDDEEGEAADVRNWFGDADDDEGENRLLFGFRAIPEAYVGLVNHFVNNSGDGNDPHPGPYTFWVRVEKDWSGVAEGLKIYGDDRQQGRAPEHRNTGPVRSIRRANAPMTALDVRRDLNVRSVRRAGGTVNNPWIDMRRDVQTDLVYNLIVVPSNDPPEIIRPQGDEDQVIFDYPDEVEGEMLTVNLTGEDIDNEAAELTWDFGEDTDLPDGTYEIVPAEDGTAVFTFTPDHTHAGNYTAEIILHDNEDEIEPNFQTDTIWLTITVSNDNRAPFVAAEQEPEIFMEDPADPPLVLWDLNEVFGDEDIAIDDALRFNIVSQPANVNTSIGNGMLSVNPTPNFHTMVDEEVRLIDIEIRAIDNEDASVNYTFQIGIEPVNDLPDPFALRTPANNSRAEVVDENNLGMLTFSWDAATQNGGAASNQWEADDIIGYMVYFTLDLLGDDEVFEYGPIFETSLVDVDPNAIADENEFEYDTTVVMTWWVEASDSAMMPTRSTSEFTLILPKLSVDDYGPEVPTVHFMSPSYPNPFNSTSHVRFGIPVPGNVEVTVWDMHGRKVATLADGQYSAGRYEATWVADRVPSGVYLIRMQSGEFTALNKAILMK
ncbi:choice-of-anchor D domain-containing protein [Calditrichota bacterium]